MILGIDELTLLHQRRCIIVDVGQKRTLDLLPNMGKPSVAHWLSLMQGKERVQVVTMDMWDPYREVVRAVLPQARIVIDKWHIQKKANDALDRVRARHRRGGKTKASRKNPWRLKRTLLARPKNLRPKAMLLLDGLLKNNPLVSDAWHTKERFFDIWEADDRKTAERLYDEWKASIPEAVAVEFGAVAKTVENWKGEIFAYFDARFTNAFTEATNGLIKAINRDGRGYRFEAIRAKALNMAHASDGRFVVCECCLGQFPQDPSLGQHLSAPLAKATNRTMGSSSARTATHSTFRSGSSVMAVPHQKPDSLLFEVLELLFGGCLRHGVLRQRRRRGKFQRVGAQPSHALADAKRDGDRSLALPLGRTPGSPEGSLSISSA